MFVTIFSAISIVFSLILIGAILKWKDILNNEVQKQLTKIFLWILFPCFIFYNTVGVKVLADIKTIFNAFIFGFGIYVCSILIVKLFLILFRLKLTKNQSRTFVFSTALQNYGYIPVPLVGFLFQDKAILSLLFLHNSFVELAVWSFGIVILNGKFNMSNIKKVINPCSITIFISIIITLFELQGYIPSFIMKFTQLTGNAAIPLILLTIGATIANTFLYLKGYSIYKVIKNNISLIISAISFRHLILPIFMLAMVFVIPSSEMMKKIIIIQASMPVALFPIIIAKNYNASTNTAVKIALFSSILSLVTTPLWILLGFQLFGFKL